MALQIEFECRSMLQEESEEEDWWRKRFDGETLEGAFATIQIGAKLAFPF
jgi:hypothetical protein